MKENEVEYRELSFMGLFGYRVGTDGSVWSIRHIKRINSLGENRWKRKIPTMHNDGYLFVGFFGRKNARVISVHSLVLSAFVGNRPEGAVARHFPDKDPTNNTLENLSWSTQKENLADRKVHGTLRLGEKNTSAKLTRKSVQLARKLRQKGMGWSELARDFGVDRTTICRTIKGITWK